MRLAPILLILLLALPGLAQRANHKCEVEAVKRSDGCDIYVSNGYGVEITVTINAELENMRSSEPLPFTVTVPGRRRVMVMSLLQDEPRLSWRYNYSTHWCWGSTGVVHDDTVVYRLPYASGEAFPVLQGYDGRFSHSGDNACALDFSMPDGTPVHAAREGVVVDTEDGYKLGGHDRRLGGNYVLVRHADGTIAEYFHLNPGGVAVRVGQVVQAGDLLGYSGHTGFADGPHLHFMVFRAVNGHHRESFPTRFEVDGESEPVQLREGRAYRCP